MDNNKSDKKLEKVVTGKTTVSKNTDPGNMLSKFLVEGVQAAGKSMVLDVFLPKCKQAVYDALQNGLSILFWGPGGVRKNNNLGTGTRINYTSPNGVKTSVSGNQRVTPAVKKPIDPEDVTFETRLDAQNVYDTMLDIIERFEKVSLGEFLELANVSNDDYTYYKYGWEALPPADIRRLGNGSYYIRFPKMQII